MKTQLIIFALFCQMVIPANAAETSKLWQAFKQAKESGNASTLPDFSYAGYALGEKGIPAATGKIFNIIDFGAIPNDNQSDREAIEKAIRAAEKNRGGIVFFPAGVFHVNEAAGRGAGIEIHGSNIVLKGSGSGPGGTEIFMREHLMPRDPKKLYSVPKMFEFKPPKNIPLNRKHTTIINDAYRETFAVEVADTAGLRPGMLVELSMNNPAANEAFLAGLTPWSIWKNTVEKGVKIRGERHRIKRINGHRITFNEPLHCNVFARHGWTVSSSALVSGWRVEDIHFRGNWKGEFEHHKDFIHDGGWGFISFKNGDSPVLQRCRFTDCSSAAGMSACYSGTIINCSIEGNRGHSSFASAQYSYGTLIAFCLDMVENGAFHGFAANSGAVGTVITHCKNSNRGFDWHASWPYCTLIDASSGGLLGNGGHFRNLPNHMRYLVFWNFEQTAGKVYKKFDWWKAQVGDENYSGAKVVKPIIVGFHGLETTFNPESCQVLESYGLPVKPTSLYTSQLEARLGTLPDWVGKARNAYDFYLENGYWERSN